MRAILSLLLLVGMVQFSWADAAADPDPSDPNDVVYVLSRKAHLKAGPRMYSPTLRALRSGDQLEVLQKNGSWLRVRFRGQEGWVTELVTTKTKPSEKRR